MFTFLIGSFIFSFLDCDTSILHYQLMQLPWSTKVTLNLFPKIMHYDFCPFKYGCTYMAWFYRTGILMFFCSDVKTVYFLSSFCRLNLYIWFSRRNWLFRSWLKRRIMQFSKIRNYDRSWYAFPAYLIQYLLLLFFFFGGEYLYLWHIWDSKISMQVIFLCHWSKFGIGRS